MSTYLQLAKYLAREVQAPGGENAIAAVTGNVGQAHQYVSWIKDSWVEIQNRNDGLWRWLKRDFTLTTTASTRRYAYTDCEDTDAGAAISRFSKWFLHDLEDPPRIYPSSTGVAGEVYLTWAPYEQFNQVYGIGSNRTTEGFPAHITNDHQDRLILGYVPNAEYVVSGMFYRSPQILAADADEPEMPSRYHMLIVYNAIEKYGYQAAAPEALARAEKEGGRMIRQLEASQLSRFRIGGPLA